VLEIPKSGLRALLRVRRLAKRQEEFIDVVRRTPRVEQGAGEGSVGEDIV
jgi:hypothetical protein